MIVELLFDPGGAAVCVYHRGDCVVDLWGGYRDEEGTLWTSDTMAPSFSTTKGVASTLLHIYADRGLIDYDKPVREYWPEFGQAGKENLTVRQLMCHEGGLYAISEMVDHASEMLDWDQMIDIINNSVVASPLIGFKVQLLKERGFAPMFTANQMAKRIETTGGPSLLGKGGQAWPGLDVCSGCPMVKFEKVEE